jgi:hypothetical protein
MAEVQWRLRGWTEVPATPFEVQIEFDCISTPTKPLDYLLSLVKHCSMLLR